MMTKFIKLTTESGDEYHINPLFITEIKKTKSLSESQPDMATVVMINGDRVRPLESVEEIMKKIKDTEKFILTNK